jgi:tetratricopeptide (TPR) repeat protein
LLYSYDARGAEEELKKAIQLKPSDVDALNGYHWILLFRHRWNDALGQMETAVGLDPLSPLLCGNHGGCYYRMGDYRRALELFKRAVDLGGSDMRGDVAFMYGKMKMFEEMRREYEAWAQLRKASWPLAEKYTHAEMACLEDNKEKLRGLLFELEAHVGEEHGIDASTVAVYCFYLGENDKGFAWLERSYSRREVGLLYATFDPRLEGVCNDPRYLDFLKRLGLD